MQEAAAGSKAWWTDDLHLTPSQLRMTLIARQGGSFLNTLMKHPEPLRVITSLRICTSSAWGEMPSARRIILIICSRVGPVDVYSDLVTFRLILRFCIYVQVQSLPCHTETPFGNRPDKTIEFKKPPPVKSWLALKAENNLNKCGIMTMQRLLFGIYCVG